jgi:hypothetical protein
MRLDALLSNWPLLNDAIFQKALHRAKGSLAIRLVCNAPDPLATPVF